jgi:hypothetical protein
MHNHLLLNANIKLIEAFLSSIYRSSPRPIHSVSSWFKRESLWIQLPLQKRLTLHEALLRKDIQGNLEKDFTAYATYLLGDISSEVVQAVMSGDVG